MPVTCPKAANIEIERKPRLGASNFAFWPLKRLCISTLGASPGASPSLQSLPPLVTFQGEGSTNAKNFTICPNSKQEKIKKRNQTSKYFEGAGDPVHRRRKRNKSNIFAVWHLHKDLLRIDNTCIISCFFTPLPAAGLEISLINQSGRGTQKPAHVRASAREAWLAG